MCTRLKKNKIKKKKKTALAVESVENSQNVWDQGPNSKSGRTRRVSWLTRFPGTKPSAVSGMFYVSVNHWRLIALQLPSRVTRQIEWRRREISPKQSWVMRLLLRRLRCRWRPQPGGSSVDAYITSHLTDELEEKKATTLHNHITTSTPTSRRATESHELISDRHDTSGPFWQQKLQMWLSVWAEKCRSAGNECKVWFLDPL